MGSSHVCDERGMNGHYRICVCVILEGYSVCIMKKMCTQHMNSTKTPAAGHTYPLVGPLDTGVQKTVFCPKIPYTVEMIVDF
jgi:hypothetical protein